MSSLHRVFALFLKSADKCFKDTPKALLEKGTKFSPKNQGLNSAHKGQVARKLQKPIKSQARVSQTPSKRKLQKSKSTKQAKTPSKP